MAAGKIVGDEDFEAALYKMIHGDRADVAGSAGD
jgi:hypothetical protein